MTIWEKIILDQLHAYPRWKKAIEVQIPSEIATLRESIKDMTGLKATNLDKMPSGGETAEDRLLTAMAQIEFLEREKGFREMQIADIERKLESLPPDERKVLDMIILGKKARELALEMGYEERHIYNKRAEALRHIAQMMGAE